LGSLKSKAAWGKVVPADREVWVFLLQYTGILLKYLLVSSGIAVEEFDGGTHHLRHLREQECPFGQRFL